MLHILPSFQANHLDLIPTDPVGPKLGKHEFQKQIGLNAISDVLCTDAGLTDPSLKECLDTLLLGILGKREDSDATRADMLSLFENARSITGLGNRKCPRSASLALIAFTLKVFGDKIVNHGAIYRKDLEIGLNMLFGKNIVDVGHDIFDMLDSLRIDINDGVYTLSSNNYKVNVKPSDPPRFESDPDNPDKRSSFFTPFVNSQNIRASFFHNFSKPTIHAFFGGERYTPTEIEACCEKSKAFHSSPNGFAQWFTDRFSMRRLYLEQQQALLNEAGAQGAKPKSLEKEKLTKENTVDKSYLHSQNMVAGTEPLFSQITSRHGDDEYSHSFRMYYPVDCAPANLNKKDSIKIVKRETDPATEVAGLASIRPDRLAQAEAEKLDTLVTEDIPRDQSIMESHSGFINSIVAPVDQESSEPSKGEKAQALSKLPVNSYRVEFGRQKNGGAMESSEVNLVASQVGGTPAENRAKARTVIRAMIEKAQEHTTKTTFKLIDVRLMIENNKKLVFGSELKVFKEHTAAMRGAAEDISKELGVKIEYRPIFQQANSKLESVGLAATGVIVKPKFPETGRADFSVVDELSKMVARVPRKDFGKLENLFNKWNFLFGERGKSDSSARFVATSELLLERLNKVSRPSDPHNLLITGCYSAKDRTMAVVAALWILLPFMRLEMDKEGGNIGRFFHGDGTFNYEGLSAEEKLQFQKHFDLNMFHIQNLIQNGADTNINVDLFKNLFPTVKFIQEADFTPVRVKH